MSAQYLTGFGNEHQSEALAGTLPQGQFSPQQVARRPVCRAIQQHRVHRAARRESPHVVLSHPSLRHARRVQARTKVGRLVRSAPITEVVTPPNQLRWDPLSMPIEPTDFIEGLVTFAANGDVRRSWEWRFICMRLIVR